MRSLLIGLSFTLLVSSPMQAQVCSGLPSLATTRGSLTGGIGFGNDVTAYSVRGGAGTPNAFAGVSVGRATSETFDDVSSTAVGFDAGVPIAVGTGSLRLCPVVAVAREWLSVTDGTETLDISVMSYAGGLSLGGVVNLSAGVQLIPFSSARLLHQQAKATAPGFSESESESGMVLGFGASLLLNETFTITPSLSFPVGYPGDPDPTFSIAVGIVFRR